MERPDDVIHYSITEFAHIVGVSEATIHRLVRRLSFDGYQSFKITLTRETTEVRLVIPTESNPLLDYISEMSSLIEKLKKTLNVEQIGIVVQKILESRRIIFFGVGLSSVSASYGSLLFSLLGLPTFRTVIRTIKLLLQLGFLTKTWSSQSVTAETSEIL